MTPITRSDRSYRAIPRCTLHERHGRTPTDCRPSPRRPSQERAPAAVLDTPAGQRVWLPGLPKLGGQVAKREAAMADRVFVGGAQFGGRVLEARRNKDRVVAEAVVAAGCARQPTNNTTMRTEFAAVGEDRNGRALKRGTQPIVRGVAYLRQHELEVRGVAEPP